LCAVFADIRLLQRLSWAENPDWFSMQPIYMLAQIMLIVFLFFLFAGQKSS
jgi:hypothetical protein